MSDETATPSTDPTPPGFEPPPPLTQPMLRPPGAPRRLYRSTTDRKLGGVAAGVAEFLGVDPTIVRIATLVLAFTGVGILVYIAMWIIVPAAPEGQEVLPRAGLLMGERSMNVAIGVAAIALAIGILSGSWVLLALALIGGGVWLLSEQTATSEGDRSVAGGDLADDTWLVADSGAASATSAASSPYVARPVPAARQRQNITWITLSLVAMLIGVSIAAEAGDWWHLDATVVLGLVIVVIAGGVIAGVIRGRGARGLVAIGILAALALVPVAALDGLVDEGVGDSVHRPQRIEDLRSSYRLGVGSLTVDLSDLDFEGRSERVDIDLGMGELVVIVPRNVGGTVELDAGAGEIAFEATTGGARDEGVKISMGPIQLEGTDGTVDLDVHVGLGAATVQFAQDR